jgi:hypothetical protein
VWVFGAGLVSPALVRGEINDPQYRADLQAIAAEPRIIGSPGYDRAAAYLRDQIKQLPNVELREHEYPVMVPVTKSAVLRIDGTDEPVYPFWPAQIRHNATPEEGITGRLVYCGTADFDEIPPADLHGQIAVIEAAAQTFWQNAPYFGANAVIVLGSPETNNVDLRSHDLTVPVNVPRFYVPPGPLADRLRSGGSESTGTLLAEVNWERKTARNLYALVKPTHAAPQPGLMPAPAGWYERDGQVDPKVAPPAALMYSVPFDSSGLVPDLAVGAGQAANTAAGLALLRDVAEQPLDRPMVVSFGGADSIQFLATRNMFLALSDVPSVWRQELEERSVEEAQAAEDLERLSAIADEPQKLNVARDRKLIDRIVKIVETDLAVEQDQLFRIRRARPEEKTDAMRADEKRLEARQVWLNQLKYSFQQRPGQLTGEALDDARTYVRRTLDRLGGAEGEEGLIRQFANRRRELEQRIGLYEWLAGAIGRDKDPSDRTNNSRLIELLVALDLSDDGVRVGPLYWGQFQQTSNISQIQDYRDWFNKQERALTENKPEAQWLAGVRGVIDFEPLSASRAPQSWLVASMPIGSELAQAWGVPGFSMVTLDDPRLRRDTPTDTLENFKVDRVLPQLKAVAALFRQGWNDAKFKGQPELKWQRNGIVGQVVSAAPGRPVPDLPREGFLATYQYASSSVKRIPPYRWQPWTMGIRRNEVRDCDNEGRYQFEGLPRLNGNFMLFALQMYRVEPGTGAITACTDLGKQSADIKAYADINQTLDPFRSVVFTCEEFTLVGLYDPRFLQTLGEVIPLDARRNAEPQRYNILLHNQLMAGFVEPGARSYLVFRYGRVGNRLLLINMPDQGKLVPSAAERASAQAARDAAAAEDLELVLGTGATRPTTSPVAAGPADPAAGAKPAAPARESRAEGDGFTVEELNHLEPLSLVTSRDFWRLNDSRLTKYRRAGVSSSLIDEMHAQAREQIIAAEAAYRANDGAGVVREANGAWANNARVYSATDDMARDVVRAAIFLLMLCVPFAFCMERLLVGTPSVYRQIAYVLGFFAVMTAALWSFHPAFRISSSPLIIILAFAIIFMSIVVITVVYGKFDTELKKIRSGRGTAEGASFARASVLMSAILLGIANMRKRKFRTALTAVTIVLITFAVLCFTSATRYVGTTTLPMGISSDHPGLMLRQRGFRQMPPNVVKNLRPVLEGIEGPSRGERVVVERWWNLNAGDPKDQLHVVATGPTADGSAASKPRIFPSQAVLGLSPGESQISRIEEVIGPERYARLERGERDIIYLASTIAEQLKVKEGDRVALGGLPLEVAGVFSADDFDQRVMTLSGDPVAPLKYTPGALDAGGRALSDTAAESLDLDADSSAAEAGSTYEHLSASQFVIVPDAISRALPNSSIRSVAIELANEAEVKAVSDELAKRFAVAMFAGFDDGVRMVAASNLSSVSGAGQVAIPLAIAGLIIFNTMMGSIAERKREIHVYTSLGLAPLHVGALFVAEAMTYGLIGTVFGYVIGQGAGTALLKLGWLGNVTLNYSGTSAILTMGLILLIVLLSALVPARLASKIAAPSIERSWKVPLPKGDEILAVLPFTINKTAADGALAYLAEYFDAHQEGSIGKFSAGKVEVFDFEDADHRTSRGLKTVVWLTPFDLGVRQHLMLLVHPGQYEDIYEVQVVLQRLSGDDGSWYRMNRTFLTELRKQFLQWRSLTPQRMMEYVEESRRLFKQVPTEVVTTTAGEEVRLG